MSNLVIDACAAVSLVVDWDGKGGVIADVIRGNTLVAPDLIYLETSNAIRKLAINKAQPFTWQDAATAVEMIKRLRLRTVAHKPLLDHIWDDDTIRRIDPYDGAYAAIARLLDVPLVTTDTKNTFAQAKVKTVIGL